MHGAAARGDQGSRLTREPPHHWIGRMIPPCMPLGRPALSIAIASLNGGISTCLPVGMESIGTGASRFFRRDLTVGPPADIRGGIGDGCLPVVHNRRAPTSLSTVVIPPYALFCPRFVGAYPCLHLAGCRYMPRHRHGRHIHSPSTGNCHQVIFGHGIVLQGKNLIEAFLLGPFHFPLRIRAGRAIAREHGTGCCMVFSWMRIHPLDAVAV